MTLHQLRRIEKQARGCKPNDEFRGLAAGQVAYLCRLARNELGREEQDARATAYEEERAEGLHR